MPSLGTQQALLQAWAYGTDFVLDKHKQTKAEFARLANAKGWIANDGLWKVYWGICFGDSYIASATTTSPTTDMTANADTMAGIPTTIHDSSYDLVEHMRRLSDASDGSSYSVVSNPSTYSFGTDASFAGGITVGTANIEALEAGIQAVTLSDRDTKAETRPDHGVGSTKSDKKKSPPKAKSTKPKSAFAPVSPFWLNFPGFVPDPKARFKAEFARLAGHQGWGKKRKRKYEVEALSAEATAFYGTCETRLDHWHQLCEDVGIEPVPKSITQCRKALTSRSVYVNLYNLIDHRRNPDVEVKRFESYGAFSKYTKAGRTFPRAIAKQDGVIKVLLKKL